MRLQILAARGAAVPLRRRRDGTNKASAGGRCVGAACGGDGGDVGGRRSCEPAAASVARVRAAISIGEHVVRFRLWRAGAGGGGGRRRAAATFSLGAQPRPGCRHLDQTQRRPSGRREAGRETATRARRRRRSTFHADDDVDTLPAVTSAVSVLRRNDLARRAPRRRTASRTMRCPCSSSRPRGSALGAARRVGRRAHKVAGQWRRRVPLRRGDGEAFETCAQVLARRRIARRRIARRRVQRRPAEVAQPGRRQEAAGAEVDELDLALVGPR